MQSSEDVYTLPKTNMDTQNDGLEKVTPFTRQFLVSMLNFWGVNYEDETTKTNMVPSEVSDRLTSSFKDLTL